MKLTQEQGAILCKFGYNKELRLLTSHWIANLLPISYLIETNEIIHDPRSSADGPQASSFLGSCHCRTFQPARAYGENRMTAEELLQ